MEFKVALDNRDYRALFNPYILKWGTESIPSPEHYIPAIITLGTAYPDETVETIYSWFELGSIGRRAFGFGIVS
jgi:aromatic ring-opening dioxygenase catalytic subunit (LigB family)